MKIRSITPIAVGPEELARRQARYDRLSPKGIKIVLEDLPADANPPRQLASDVQIRDSEALTHRLAAATDPKAFDAVMPDCVLDPAVTALDTDAPVPTIGITRASAYILAALGQRFGVVTRNEVIGAEFRAVIERYGLGELFDDVYVLGLSIEDVSNDEVWNRAITQAAVTAKEKGVKILINGCSAVEVTLPQDVQIVDPTALALKTLRFGVEAGLLPAGEEA